MPRRDEGPSLDDLRRFGSEADTTGYCPECGAEVYDDADACPKCFAWITGRTLHKPPEDLALQKKVRQVIVFITLLTMFPIVLRLLGILSFNPLPSPPSRTPPTRATLAAGHRPPPLGRPWNAVA